MPYASITSQLCRSLHPLYHLLLIILASELVAFAFVQDCLAARQFAAQNFPVSQRMVSPTLQDGDALFGKFIIPKSHIFYQSEAKASMAFVNLRPLVQGHVLVVSKRVVPMMEDLTDKEYQEMWDTVRIVQRILKEKYPESTAFNVAVQDGRAAGQSVPHVHVHILPRKDGDYERNDDVYTDLEEWAPRPDLADSRSPKKLDVPEDDQRRDRTSEEMANEAEGYRRIFRENILIS